MAAGGAVVGQSFTAMTPRPLKPPDDSALIDGHILCELAGRFALQGAPDQLGTDVGDAIHGSLHVHTERQVLQLFTGRQAAIAVPQDVLKLRAGVLHHVPVLAVIVPTLLGHPRHGSPDLMTGGVWPARIGLDPLNRLMAMDILEVDELGFMAALSPVLPWLTIGIRGCQLTLHQANGGEERVHGVLDHIFRVVMTEIDPPGQRTPRGIMRGVQGREALGVDLPHVLALELEDAVFNGVEENVGLVEVVTRDGIAEA
jgi:hypothetical protein